MVRPRDLARGLGLGVDRCRNFLRTGAGDKIVSTRGFRGDRSAEGTEPETDGSAGFCVKSASAARRALVILSRSSPRRWCCCWRWSSKGRPDCLTTRAIEAELVNFGKSLGPVPGEWHPRIPERLDEEELADWQAGRNAVYQLAALTIGVGPAALEYRCRFQVRM
jgi:hypothetical protein